MTRIPLLPTLCALGAAAVLAACGGGGSSEPDNRLGLNADNYVRAGQEALSAGLQFEESTELVVGAQVTQVNEASFVRLALRVLAQLDPAAALQPKLATGLIITSTYNCENANGRYTLAANDVNSNNKFDAGDGLTYTFVNCTLGGDTANGAVNITIKTLTGDLSTAVYNGSVGIAMTNLALTGSSGSYTGDGQFDIALVGTAPNTGSATITASSFRSVAHFGSVSSTRTLTGFNVSETHVPDTGGQRSTMRFDGSLASSGLDNRSFTLATSTPFVVTGGSTYPSSGVATVAGSGGGSVRITALSATDVQFELDANGDGVFETSATRKWTDVL